MQLLSQPTPDKSFKKIALATLTCIAFFLWTLLGSIFLFLPPMIGVLFILFMEFYSKKNTTAVVTIVLCLIIYESEKQLPLGTLPIVFVVVNYLIVERFNIIFGHNAFFVFWYIIAVYGVYFLALYIIKMFGAGVNFSLSAIFIYYFIIESSLMLIYEQIKWKRKKW